MESAILEVLNSAENDQEYSGSYKNPIEKAATLVLVDASQKKTEAFVKNVEGVMASCSNPIGRLRLLKLLDQVCTVAKRDNLSDTILAVMEPLLYKLAAHVAPRHFDASANIAPAKRIFDSWILAKVFKKVKLLNVNRTIANYTYTPPLQVKASSSSPASSLQEPQSVRPAGAAPELQLQGALSIQQAHSSLLRPQSPNESTASVSLPPRNQEKHRLGTEREAHTAIERERKSQKEERLERPLRKEGEPSKVQFSELWKRTLLRAQTFEKLEKQRLSRRERAKNSRMPGSRSDGGAFMDWWQSQEDFESIEWKPLID